MTTGATTSPPSISAAVVNYIRKHQSGHYCVGFVDRHGSRELVVRVGASLTALQKAIVGTTRGYILVDIWVLNERYVARVAFTKIPTWEEAFPGAERPDWAKDLD